MQNLDRRIDKYTELVKEFLMHDKRHFRMATTETARELKRARQRCMRRRAALLGDGISVKSLDAAYMEAAVCSKYQ